MPRAIDIAVPIFFFSSALPPPIPSVFLEKVGSRFLRSFLSVIAALLTTHLSLAIMRTRHLLSTKHRFLAYGHRL